MNSGKLYYTLHDYGVLKLHHATTLSLVTSCSYEHHGIKPCLNCPSSFPKLLHILFSFVFTDCFKRLFNKSRIRKLQQFDKSLHLLITDLP